MNRLLTSEEKKDVFVKDDDEAFYDTNNDLFITSEEEKIKQNIKEGNAERIKNNMQPLDTTALTPIIHSMRENYRNIHKHFLLLKYGVDNGMNIYARELSNKYNSSGGKLKAKGHEKKTLKKPVVSQNKENKYKEVLGKRMKIYKKTDSRKEFVRYKGELVPLVEYKKSMK